MANIKGCYQFYETLAPIGKRISEDLRFRYVLTEEKRGHRLILDDFGGTARISVYAEKDESLDELFAQGEWYSLFPSRMIDFGETEQTVSEEFFAYLNANAAPVHWDTVIDAFYTKITGKWKWKSALDDAEMGFLSLTSDCSVTANGIAYKACAVGNLKNDGSTAAALLTAQEEMLFVYDAQLGWTEPNAGTETPKASTLWQTWDFGKKGILVFKEYAAYLNANAERISDGKTNILYGDRLLFSLSEGQKATLHCNKKRMTDDLVIQYFQKAPPSTEHKTVIPSRQTQTVSATDADYLSQVTVEPIPSDYEIPVIFEANASTVIVGKMLISFFIGELACSAQAGMSWREWLDSVYNADGFYSVGNLVYTPDGLSDTGIVEGVRTDHIISPIAYTVQLAKR